MISPQYGLDDLVSCGLLNRPELASQKAVVQATLELLRQEKLRPLLPSVVLQGSGPDGTYTGGVFGGGRGGKLGDSSGRADVNLGLVWTLENLGMGNRAHVRGRAADEEKALVELFELQDRVAEEVVQAQASVEGAGEEIPQAETAVREATITFAGTLRGLTQVRGAGSSAANGQSPAGRRGGPPAVEPGLPALLRGRQPVQPGRVSTLSRHRLSFADPAGHPRGRGR